MKITLIRAQAVRLTVVLAASLAGGCASAPWLGTSSTDNATAPPQEEAPPAAPSRPKPAPRPNVNLTGYPPAFQAGYSDGCTSARSAQVRDEARFKSDAQYAQGWRDGNSICRAR
jgi:hypothetical protein